MEFLEVGDDFITGRIPVDERTRQPYGLLHGGVSVVLAETLGSCGAVYACKPGTRAVGLDINANHIRGAMAGWVTGITKPVHVGPQHAGVGDRAVRRRGQLDLRVADHDGGAGRPRMSESRASGSRRFASRSLFQYTSSPPFMRLNTRASTNIRSDRRLR